MMDKVGGGSCGGPTYLPMPSCGGVVVGGCYQTHVMVLLNALITASPDLDTRMELR